MEKKETFTFTYSAKEQEEIKKIRSKYMPENKTEDKMEKLRQLDREVTSKATTASLVVGIIGALIMGLGMSLAMTELGKVMGVNGELSMLIGILIGVVGIVLVCLSYPIYNRTLRKQREKAAPEILRLTEELMK